jgi:flagellar protein FlgJ
MDSAALLQAQSALANTKIHAPEAGKTHAQAKEAAQKFESVFLSQYLNYMFDGLPTNGLFDGGQGEKMMRSMLVDQYAKSIAAHGGIGIADAVARELIHIQEGGGNVIRSDAASSADASHKPQPDQQGARPAAHSVVGRAG